MYENNRPTGSPKPEFARRLSMEISDALAGIRVPGLLPHRSYSRLLPPHDSTRILLQDMLELYSSRGIDTSALALSANRYDSWLISLRRTYRRTRSLPGNWLESRYQEAISGEELSEVLGNEKLARFLRRILQEPVHFSYLSLSLESNCST